MFHAGAYASMSWKQEWCKLNLNPADLTIYRCGESWALGPKTRMMNDEFFIKIPEGRPKNATLRPSELDGTILIFGLSVHPWPKSCICARKNMAACHPSPSLLVSRFYQQWGPSVSSVEWRLKFQNVKCLPDITGQLTCHPLAILLPLRPWIFFPLFFLNFPYQKVVVKTSPGVASGTTWWESRWFRLFADTPVITGEKVQYLKGPWDQRGLRAD